MENEEKKYLEFHCMLDRFFEDEATQEESLKIQEYVLNDPVLKQYYFRYVELKSGLHQLKSLDTADYPSEENIDEIFFELAEYEKTAPEIEIPKEKPPRELVQKVIYPTQQERKVSKFQIVTFIMSTAAILFFVLFFRFAPVTSNEPVAILSRTVEAQWQDASGNTFADGCDLYAGPMDLVRGYAEITLNEGAIVVVQAPAQFTLESAQQIYLQQGKVVARKEGHSEQTFLVRTPHASVVDYGTEFGVKVDSTGQTETYVYEGQVQIRDSSNPIKFTKSMLLKAGQGAMADTSSNLSYGDIDPKPFVRPDELNARYFAQKKDSGYYRWKASMYQLHRDPTLIAHYIFEKPDDYSHGLVNSVSPIQNEMSGRFGDTGKGKPVWVQGRWPQKSAVRFERDKKQAIVISSNETLCVTQPLTICAWLYFPDAEQWGGHIIACRDNESNINYQFSLFDKNYVYNYQKNRFEFRQYRQKDSLPGFYSDLFVPESGEWYHAVVVYDGTELRFYVNGKLFQSASYEGMPESTSAEIVIGAVKKGGEYVFEEGDFNGVLDELMLFNRTLSDAELRAMYNAGKP